MNIPNKSKAIHRGRRGHREKKETYSSLFYLSAPTMSSVDLVYYLLGVALFADRINGFHHRAIGLTRR